MKRRAVALLIRLYPRAWRDRYGDEVRDLTDELFEAGDLSHASGLIGLTGAAFVAHGQTLRASRRAPVLLVSAVVVLVGAMTTYSATNRASGPATTTYDLTVVGPMGHARTLVAHQCVAIGSGKAVPSATLLVGQRGISSRATLVFRGATMSCGKVALESTGRGRQAAQPIERLSFEPLTA